MKPARLSLAAAAFAAVLALALTPLTTAACSGTCGPKAAQKPAPAVTYVCPMQACDVASEKPGACPKCGIFLEARPKDASTASPADPHAGHNH